MRKSQFLMGCALATGLATCATSAMAQDFSYKGSITSDLRFTVPGQDMPGDVDKVRFDRTDNTFRFTGAFTWGVVDAVADVSVTFSGQSEVSELYTDRRREHVDPLYFESEALYVRISDFIIDGLDIRLGRQIIDWGSADRFNPTSVINGLDLEDYQDFGRRVANEMINITYTPGWEVEGEETPIFSEFQIQLVWVPCFKSGLIPESSEYLFGGPDQFRRFVRASTLKRLVDLQQAYVDNLGSINYHVTIDEPSRAIENSQVALRVGFSLLGVDINLMGYYGYDHLMQPKDIKVDLQTSDSILETAINAHIDKVADPEQFPVLLDLMNQLGPEHIRSLTGNTDVKVTYPRVWVVGADFATSLDFMGGVGLWGEFSVTFHDDLGMNIDINGTKIRDVQEKKGAFFKGVVGIDNTFTKWLYVNMQYIYGFVDEFGASDLGHYLMINGDFKAFNEQMLFRLSVVMQLTEPSAIIMPSFSFRFWPGTELIAGALLHAGTDDSTFGNRVAGPNYVFLQAKYSF